MSVIGSSQLVQFFVVQRYFTSTVVSRRLCNSYTYVSTNAVDYVVGSKVHWATSFNTQVYHSIASCLPRGTGGIDIDVWAVNIPGDVFQLEANGTSAPLPADRLPLSTAVYFQRNCGLRGRQWYGTFRHGPIRSGDVLKDELTAAALTRYNAAAAALSATIINTGISGTDKLAPVVWSRSASTPSVPPAAQQVAFISSVFYDKTLSSWRHRREKTNR